MWSNGIIPVAMERMRADANLRELLIGYLDTGLVRFGIDCGLYLKPLAGSCVTDQFNNSFDRNQWFAAPVQRDEREKAMFDLIPLAGARWKMTDGQLQSGFISQVLQGDLPQARAGRIAAAVISSSFALGKR